MKAQNREQVTKKTRNFWLLFILLVSFVLLQIKAFTWATRQQEAIYMVALQGYRETVNKQTELRDKVDSLYTQMSYLDIKKVDNYLYLENVIFGNKTNIENYINTDSSHKFAAYYTVLSHLKQQLFLKDSLIQVENQENTIKRDLINCIGKNKIIKSNILSQQRNY